MMKGVPISDEGQFKAACFAGPIEYFRARDHGQSGP